MGLSCSCDFDFDGDTPWYERGGERVPPAGSTCCECHAPLPAGEPAQTFYQYAPYVPEGEPPPYADDAMEDEPDDPAETKLWRERYAAMEKAREDWDDEHGWNSEYECYAEESADYRCDRCAGLATALDGSKQEGGLGYCMIIPGELIEAHRDYIEQTGGHEMIWKRGRDGVLNPRRMTRLDFAKREARRRWRNAVYIVFQGGWKHKVAMARARTVGRAIHFVMPRLGYQYHYDYDAKRHRWTRPEKREVV